MRRPQAIVVGTLLMGSRVLAGLFAMVEVGLNWSAFTEAIVIDGAPAGGVRTEQAGLALGILLGLYGAILALELGLVIFVYLGRNWARLVAMSFATLSIGAGFIDYLLNGVAITFRTSLLSLTLDILVLLALSSTAARGYASRAPASALRSD